MTEDMKQFEKKTGKRAIWDGKITENFKKWLKGQKLYTYSDDRERWTAYVSSELNTKWEDFIEKNNYSKSKLIRDSVNLLINIISQLKNLGKEFDYKSIKRFTQESIDFYLDEIRTPNSQIYEDLKQSLTPLKGFIQLAIDFFNEKDKSINFLMDAKEGYNVLEEKIKNYYKKPPLTKLLIKPKYNVLYIEDDEATVNIVSTHVERKGYTIKSVGTAKEGLKELKYSKPDLILIDIGLPGEIQGNELVKKLRSRKEYKEMPMVFISAIISEDQIKKIKAETKITEIIMKPFEFEDLDVIFNYLKKPVVKTF